MDIRFPVFVLKKDCGEVVKFDSVYEMQYHMEEIDVENNEYDAWDCNGVKLQLGVQKPMWLRLEAGELDLESLRKALTEFAKTVGFDSAELTGNSTDFGAILERIRQRAELHRKEQSWWRKLSPRG